MLIHTSIYANFVMHDLNATFRCIYGQSPCILRSSFLCQKIMGFYADYMCAYAATHTILTKYA
jgi:hypothetical protein